MAGKKKIIKPGPIAAYPVTQPSGDRPSLGSGMAESAAQDLETRQTRVDRAIRKATGNKRKPRKNYEE